MSAILAYETVTKLLTEGGYERILGSTGLWKHKSRHIMFALCVDDFGVQYFKKNDVHYLIDVLSEVYKVTSDWTGRNFLGYHLDWNYEEGYVDISMPGYLTALLERLQHTPKIYPQYSPHHYQPIVYGVKGAPQYATATSTSP